MPPTKIDWCTRVWNPVTGCSKVSEGCKNCYAESIARRFWHGRSFGDVQCHESRLEIPLHWRKPQIVFVNSMSDLFHEKVSFEYIDKVFVMMQEAIGHIFIILTKREDRMLEYYQRLEGENRFIHLEHAMRAMNRKLPTVTWYPFPNVWPGVSIENQKEADIRTPILLQVPAAKHIVSVEPMLESVDLEPYMQYPPLTENYKMQFGLKEFRGLDWVICGRETGAVARPFDAKWAMDLKGQCDAAHVPFWWKNHAEFQMRPE